MAKNTKIDLERWIEVPPWDWPDDLSDQVLAVLRDGEADLSDRILAAEMAGTSNVISEEVFAELHGILRRSDEDDELRCMAGISLGMGLDLAVMEDDEEGAEDSPISLKTAQEAQQSLHKLYDDPSIPVDVRRAVLEASVRQPEEWHVPAITEAYDSGDDAWRLTAVFCMGYVPGFDQQILESLNSEDADLHHEAVCAAGNFALDEAWPHVFNLATTKSTDRNLRIAAIGAMASIRPEEAIETLTELAQEDDEEIADVAEEALAMAEDIIEMNHDEEEAEEDEGEEPV